MKKIVLFWLVIFLLGCPGQSFAAVFNVSSVSEFKDALNTARQNGQDDTIHVRAGTYVLTDCLSSLNSEPYNLEIIGDEAATTVLDGGHKFCILTMVGFGKSGLTVRISNLTFLNASSSIGAFHFRSNQADVILANCRFINNEGTSHYPGAAEMFTEGSISLINNLFLDNYCRERIGAVNIQHGSGGILLLNNTFVYNAADQSNSGVFINASGEAVVSLYNNIFYHNSSSRKDYGNDLVVYSFPTVLNLYNNLFSPGADFAQARGGIISINKTEANTYNHGGNFTADPLFVHRCGDLHLRPDSPCRDAGTNHLGSANLPAVDFEGDSRVVGSAVDIGADEFDPSTAAMVMPLPKGSNFNSYSYVDHPILADRPQFARPFAVGSLVQSKLDLNVGLVKFAAPVDIYLALSSDKWPGQIFMIDSANSFQVFSSDFPAWKTNVTTAINESLFGEIDLEALKTQLAGNYTLYILAVPAGSRDFRNYYFWTTAFSL